MEEQIMSGFLGSGGSGGSGPPEAHAESHYGVGSDALDLDDLGEDGVQQLAYTSLNSPGATNDDDDTAGIGVSFITGSMWVKITTPPVVYVCADDTPGAAVWQEIPAGFSSYNVNASEKALSWSWSTCTGTIQLDMPGSPNNGDQVAWKKADAGTTLTIDGNGNNIDGAASFTSVTQYEQGILRYNGAEWERA
jgi:hypothetical protein